MRWSFPCLSLALGLIAGCGAGGPPATPPILHGGVIVPLADSNVVAEILNQTRVGKAKAVKTNVVVYLLQSDQRTPISSPPPELIVKVQGEKGLKAIPLKCVPADDDPAGSARYLSDLGSYDLAEKGGEIEVTLDGKKVVTPFRGPH